MSLIAATISAMLPGKNIMAHAREHMQIDSTKLADSMLQQLFLDRIYSCWQMVTPLKIDIGHRHAPSWRPRGGGARCGGGTGGGEEANGGDERVWGGLHFYF